MLAFLFLVIDKITTKGSLVIWERNQFTRRLLWLWYLRIWGKDLTDSLFRTTCRLSTLS